MDSLSPEFYWVAVALVTVVSVARITRLLVADKFPPIKYLRDIYEERTDGTGWQWLALCGYCVAPWVTLVVLGTGLWAGIYSQYTERSYDNVGFTIWWLFNAWWAISYLAAILMSNDGDKVPA
jgi:hypothetical protein